jgi:glycosyltransferase involved in cell wall biosynthesis
MKPRHWRWRMQGAHFELAPRINALLKQYDLEFIWISSIVDICALKGLLCARVPFVTFFHEHQMSYPLKKGQSRSAQELLRDEVLPGLHASQLLSSDLCLFSSDYNRDSFFLGLQRFFNSRPEKLSTGLNNIKESHFQRTRVCPLPLLGPFKEAVDFQSRPRRLLWNHRWEFDKDPDTFIELVIELKDKGHDFELELLGQEKRGIFDSLKEDAALRISSFGGPVDRNDYLERLSFCRVLPVTSRHDIFGLSVREAILSGVIPLLPDRMVYPECIPEHLHKLLIYKDKTDLIGKCDVLLEQGLREDQFESLILHNQKYDLERFERDVGEFLSLLNPNGKKADKE